MEEKPTAAPFISNLGMSSIEMMKLEMSAGDDDRRNILVFLTACSETARMLDDMKSAFVIVITVIGINPGRYDGFARKRSMDGEMAATTKETGT
jgi:hypothetical protein